jgi:hypothetical protein
MTSTTLRSIIVGSLSVIVFANCGSDPYSGESTSATSTDTDTTTSSTISGLYAVGVTPSRKLDLVFMIDNTPAMAPKVQKLRSAIPMFLTALKDPTDGTYPDLKIAIIDSDLGSGGQYASGSCGPNDGNNKSSFGDLGNFQVRDASSCGLNDGALWLEYTKGNAVNYEGKQDIGTVLGCLASNLGTLGCGLEHSLQAFEFALLAQSGDIPGRNPIQDTFLRPSSYLGLVLLTDEDDCSAATNGGMFGDSNHPELKGESASLRCATRSHMCSGQNLADFGPGYPTSASFSTLFSNCEARTDACPNPTDGWTGGNSSTDTSVPTDCSPLKDVKHMADELKALKGSPDDIFVAGIFGWPRSDADMATAEYKIDQVPNPNSQDTAHPKVWDYWPVCYDPNHMPKSSGFDQEAWGWGAQGGLRLSAFIDEFGANGQKYSICEPDFSGAMTGFGTAIARRMEHSLCVPADLATGKTCTVNYRIPVTNADGSLSYIVGDSVEACPAGATWGAVSADCWRIVSDQILCPDTGARLDLLRTAGEITAGAPLSPGTKLTFDCK